MSSQSAVLRIAVIASFAAGLFAGCTAAPQLPANAGAQPAETRLPFVSMSIATFVMPWKLAFLPDGRMLVTEKPGKLWLLDRNGTKLPVNGVPAVLYEGQGGLLGVFVRPDSHEDRPIYLTYSEPGPGGSSLALARANLVVTPSGARLADLQVIWRQEPKGSGGQFGGYVAFSPDGRVLFLTSGERMRETPAQDPDQGLGKIIRLTPSGGIPGDNPVQDRGRVRAETWSTGHRNPYGLAFDPAGRLWETEMGPRGGDELNLILPGRNYGWPVVSWGINYDGSPIPKHPTRPEFEEPALYWDPVIAPAGFAFYQGELFPAWRGSAFIGGLRGEGIVRIAFDGTKARQVERWDMGHRIRDVVAGPDGALWVLEDGKRGRLLRLTPR